MFIVFAHHDGVVVPHSPERAGLILDDGLVRLHFVIINFSQFTKGGGATVLTVSNDVAL